MAFRLMHIQTALPKAYYPELILKSKLPTASKDLSEEQLAY